MSAPEEFEAGTEFDALISDVVMGRPYERHSSVRINGRWKNEETWLWKGEDPANPHGGAYAGARPPRYSTSDSTALDVLKRIAPIIILVRGSGTWVYRNWSDAPPKSDWIAAAPTFALAICRAAMALQ